MAKVKNKKKAFKHRLKNKDFSIMLKPLSHQLRLFHQMHHLAPQPVAETKTVAKEEVAAKDLSFEALQNFQS